MRPLLPLRPPLDTCPAPSSRMDSNHHQRGPHAHATPTPPRSHTTSPTSPRTTPQNITPTTLSPNHTQTPRHPLSPLQPNGHQRGGPPLQGRSLTQTPIPNSPRLSEASSSASTSSLAPGAEEMFDLICSSQSRRLDEQRASIGDRLAFAIAQNNIRHLCEACNPPQPTDDFFNMLIKHQSCRLNDQRCSLPECMSAGAAGTSEADEAFFSLIQRVQAKRMDEQRVSFYDGMEGADHDHEHEHDHKPSSRPGSGSS
ncbi:G-protein-signaling modulator 1 [Engraulis encrasicolus]|uniref:G-protein-signaling modulator 1 n=1 Tax=Engraulis encrasicolus TaxID=184585 RepID=UPI002FD597AA